MKLQDKITVFTSGVNAFYKDVGQNRNLFTIFFMTLNYIEFLEDGFT